MSFSILKQKWLLAELQDYFFRIYWMPLKCIPDSPSHSGNVARTLGFCAACSPGEDETRLPRWHPSYTLSSRTGRWV